MGADKVAEVRAECHGFVQYEDIVPGVTLGDQGDDAMTILADNPDLHPQVLVTDGAGVVLDFFHLPVGSKLLVLEGAPVVRGSLLATLPPGVRMPMEAPPKTSEWPRDPEKLRAALGKLVGADTDDPDRLIRAVRRAAEQHVSWREGPGPYLTRFGGRAYSFDLLPHAIDAVIEHAFTGNFPDTTPPQEPKS